MKEDEEEMGTEHGSSGRANALLTGAMIGGALALLYAPRPGAETRNYLRREIERAREEAQELGAHARSAADHGVHGLALSRLEHRALKEEQMDGKSVGIGFLLGAIVGGALALLYAPHTGTETRDILKSKAEHTAEEALEVAEHARDIAAERLRKAKAAAAAAKQEAEAAGGAT